MRPSTQRETGNHIPSLEKIGLVVWLSGKYWPGIHGALGSITRPLQAHLLKFNVGKYCHTGEEAETGPGDREEGEVRDC